MNWNEIEGQWKEFAGKAKETWGELTDNDLLEIEGNREQLAGKLQSRYGWAREEAAKRIDEWADSLVEAVRG